MKTNFRLQGLLVLATCCLLNTRYSLPATHFEPALPGYQYSFPRDHFNHPSYQTEWWYFTGNLDTRDGRRFGFELTFFRQALQPDAPQSPSRWATRDVYLAHLAFSDVQKQRFYHYERLNRPGPGIAGVDGQQQRYWNGNWQVAWSGERQHLQAVAESFTLSLDLTPAKPLTIHGRNGVSQKEPGAGKASHYTSYTRLNTTGSIILNGQPFQVTGTSWMDHEFFTHELDRTLAGWDWFSIQLNNGDDLMLYRLRSRDGAPTGLSSGTYIPKAGPVRTLDASDFVLTPGRTWHSAATNADYPLNWILRIPSLSLALDVTTPLQPQELVTRKKIGPSYWEGLVDYRGSLGSAPITGRGYLEMTGYSK